MFVPEEEHQRHGVVKLVHLLEVGHLVEVADVEDGEVLDTVGDSWVGQLVAVCVWTEKEEVATRKKDESRGHGWMGTGGVESLYGENDEE